MQNAKIKKWVPPYTPPGEPELFYINNILATLWREPNGALPPLGNPEDPLDDLTYLMLTRRGRLPPYRLRSNGRPGVHLIGEAT